MSSIVLLARPGCLPSIARSMASPAEALQSILGDRIRMARKLLRLSQQEVARRADVDFRYFGAIERGQRNITLGTLSRIASVLGVEPFELLVPPNRVASAGVPDATRFALLLEQADELQREAVLRVLEGFTKYGATGRKRGVRKRRGVGPER